MHVLATLRQLRGSCRRPPGTWRQLAGSCRRQAGTRGGTGGWLNALRGRCRRWGRRRRQLRRRLLENELQLRQQRGRAWRPAEYALRSAASDSPAVVNDAWHRHSVNAEPRRVRLSDSQTCSGVLSCEHLSCQTGSAALCSRASVCQTGRPAALRHAEQRIPCSDAGCVQRRIPAWLSHSDTSRRDDSYFSAHKWNEPPARIKPPTPC